MQTNRDAQIVAWIGRIGAVGAEHVMRRFGMGRSMVYHRLNMLTRDGLLEHRMVLYGRPGVYTASTEGLRWQGLERLPTFKVRAGGFEHAWQVANAAVELHLALPDWDVLGEREIRSIEIDGKALFASAQVGRVADRQVLHRPDLALALPGKEVIPIEVELSVKSASRLVAICRGWARARHITTVYYLAAQEPGRAVKRAVAATHAADRVRVLALDDIPTLAAELFAKPDSQPPSTHRTEVYR